MLEVKHVEKVNQIILLLIFAIYPIIALPFILIEIYNNKRYAYSCLSIFLGYIALLYPPTGDLYRYAQDYFLFYSLDYSDFIHLLEFKIDFIHPCFLWLLGKLNVNCDVSRFIYVWFSSELIFSMFYEIFHNSQNRIMRFVSFSILILLLSFTSFLFRYGFSVILFVYGTFLVIFKNNRIKGYLFIIIAALYHFSLLIFLFSFLIQDKFNYKGNKKVALICVIGTFVFSTDIITQVINYLPFDAKLIDHLLIYTDGYYAGDFYEDHSLKYRIGVMLQKTNFILLILVYCFNYKYNKLSGWITILLMILFVFSPFAKIKARFELILVLTSLIYVIKLFADNQVKYIYKTRKILVYAGIFYTCISLWTIRRQLSLSMEEKLFLPTYAIVTSTYTEDWINRNIHPDGDLVLP